MKKLRLLLYALAAIILLLLFTNPNMKDFEEFTGVESNEVPLRRINNYFIFSTYEANLSTAKYTFVGVLKHFYLTESYIKPMLPESHE